MNVKVHSSTNAFDQLKRPWNELLTSSATNTIFGTWQWQETWWRCFGEDRALRICVVSENKQPIGIVPLVGLEGDGAARTLQFIGGADVADYLDIVAPPERVADVLTASLDALDWDVLDLHVIPKTSPMRPALAQLAQERGYQLVEEEEDVCPLFQLPTSWDAYLDGLSKKNRHELRRKIRRLEREADAKMRVTHDIAALADDVDAFIMMHRTSEGRKGRFMDARMTEFFHALARVCFMEKWLHLAFLDIDGGLSAASLSFKYGKTLALYNSAYSAELQRLSPGVLLVAYLIRDAIAGGMETFDFMRGDERYKYDLGGLDTYVMHIQVTRA
ncbi:MAG: GNAT family N-acetyltransferase [Chloroflexi bacterium]|nr:GNAT family N-acetyltransferase [Chloroflexota bacterium]